MKREEENDREKNRTTERRIGTKRKTEIKIDRVTEQGRVLDRVNIYMT